MTKLILRHYTKGSDTIDNKTRTAIGNLSGVIGIIANLIIATLKLIIGAISGAVSITADAMNNLSDSASSVITIIGFKLASQPPDKDHPYGHARFEHLSALAVSAIIIIIGFELAKTSVEKIRNPATTEFSLWVLIVLILSIAVKLWLSHLNKVLGREIHSSTLIAAATDSRNDVIATLAVLLSLIVEALFELKLDGIMGLLVALFILYSGAMLAKETVSPLIGEDADPELKGLIVDYVTSSPKVLGIHDLMVHDYGAGARFASLHVEMDKDEDPLVCHELIDDMERECFENHGVNLVIHYDPVVTDDPKLDSMRALILSILKVRDDRLSIHDFRMVPGEEHTNLLFDIALPHELRGQEQAIKKELDDALMGVEPNVRYYTVITFDSESFN